jgi:hypothetical protein
VARQTVRRTRTCWVRLLNPHPPTHSTPSRINARRPSHPPL